MQRTRGRSKQDASQAVGKELPSGMAAAKVLVRCIQMESLAAEFRSETGFPLSKSREVLVALLVQQWIRSPAGQQRLPAVNGLRLYGGQNGYDAEIVGGGGGKVEFKSSAGPRYEFLFEPHQFDFAGHRLIVLLELDAQRPSRIHLAHGSRVMKALRILLMRDRYRPKYNPDGKSTLRIFMKDQPVKTASWGQRNKLAWGLERLQKEIESAKDRASQAWSSEDWVITLDQSELDALSKCAGAPDRPVGELQLELPQHVSEFH